MIDPKQELKRKAAEQAVARVESGTIVGLGTGSTAAFAVEAIGRKLASGELVNILGIPTSVRTRELARQVGIRLTTLEDHPNVDLTIDGADEVDRNGDLIKGHGGALLWEKIVAAASRRYVIIVDESKIVDRLGSTCAVPVEVIPFGWNTGFVTMEALGANAELRSEDGEPFRTDEGHYIIDCHFQGGLSDPRRVDEALRALPGVVESGLFLGMRPEVIVGRVD